MAQILFVMTSADRWTLTDGTEHPTGFWAEEFAAPYSAFVAAGHEVVVATPGGVVPIVDRSSLAPEANGGADAAAAVAAVLESAEALRNPVVLHDVDPADFAVVFYPGGHGPMQDLAVDPDSARVLATTLASGAPLGLLCHAPAAMLATETDGASPFAGYRMTAFSNAEEKLAGLADKAPWLLEDRLVALGARYEAGDPFAPHVVVDRNLYTGQNPASSTDLAAALVAAI
ncbi:type 1 glutamine amidotransferase domain-containing protein [Pseudonocardia sp. TRM90224]|uniref:type 1 glutamine amidotransferase domain-containing protein n=1 Tax=Pseudonocardia sp. TRM90224 TaxID=2812678 RepID=UPI001E492093|nr:type 1 glutamine amidotransferase domain-containing protein [Pseudonocardia sp. TRM90224]